MGIPNNFFDDEIITNDSKTHANSNVNAPKNVNNMKTDREHTETVKNSRKVSNRKISTPASREEILSERKRVLSQNRVRLGQTMFDNQGSPCLVAVDINNKDLKSSTDKYLSHISDSIPPLAMLTLKWKRLLHLVEQYKTDKRSMLYDEIEEMKQLVEFDKKGGFEKLKNSAKYISREVG